MSAPTLVVVDVQRAFEADRRRASAALERLSASR
jgi:hypothetical protein